MFQLVVSLTIIFTEDLTCLCLNQIDIAVTLHKSFDHGHPASIGCGFGFLTNLLLYNEPIMCSIFDRRRLLLSQRCIASERSLPEEEPRAGMKKQESFGHRDVIFHHLFSAGDQGNTSLGMFTVEIMVFIMVSRYFSQHMQIVSTSVTFQFRW